MRWVSLAMLAAAGGVLALFWGDVPDRWVIHWDVHGQPNGWVTKSVLSAAGPLIIGLLSWVISEGAAATLTNSKPPQDAPLPIELRAVHATFVRAIGLAMALAAAGLALAWPLLRPRSAAPTVLASLSELALIIGGAMVWAARRTRRLRAAGVVLPEGQVGIFYKNPRDQRLWVPKASGMGWTINFGHRGAWLMTLAVVGAPLALAVLLPVLIAGRR